MSRTVRSSPSERKCGGGAGGTGGGGGGGDQSTGGSSRKADSGSTRTNHHTTTKSEQRPAMRKEADLKNETHDVHGSRDSSYRSAPLQHIPPDIVDDVRLSPNQDPNLREYLNELQRRESRRSEKQKTTSSTEAKRSKDDSTSTVVKSITPTVQGDQTRAGGATSKTSSKTSSSSSSSSSMSSDTEERLWDRLAEAVLFGDDIESLKEK